MLITAVMFDFTRIKMENGNGYCTMSIYPVKNLLNETLFEIEPFRIQEDGTTPYATAPSQSYVTKSRN